ncbi:MAG: DMT family transporter [Spirochaetales bacterium]|nr:DMT family transporter [Spirochaetales bacterium]
MDRKTGSILLLITAMIAWGSLYPVSKYIMTELNPLTLSFLRYFFGIIALTPFFIVEIQKKSDQIKAKDYLVFALTGFLGITIFAIFLFYGIKLSTASNGSIIANTQPLFTALLAPLLIHERINKFQILGLIIGFIGMLLVVTGGNFNNLSIGSSVLTGNLLLACAAVSMSIYSIFLKSSIRKFGGMIPTFLSMAAGTALLLLINIFSEGFISDLKVLARPSDLLLIVYLGCISTAFAYILFNNSLRYIDVIKASGFKFLIPVSGVGLSIIFLKERPSLFVYGGILLVFISVFFIQSSSKRGLVKK